MVSQFAGVFRDRPLKFVGGIQAEFEPGQKGRIAEIMKLTPFFRTGQLISGFLLELFPAVTAGADIIMLDNMDDETMKKAVEIIDKKALIEVSGNVTAENIKRLSNLGVDYVSSGALTHSAPILDLSLKNLRPTE